MESRKIDLLWSISLVVISLSTLVISITDAFEGGIPDAVDVIFCLIILAAVCMLIYTSLKKWQQKL